MYHIKEDLRSKNSAEKIYRSIRHLLTHKKLTEITISDIKNECGVSRSTFYRNFDNITDVLEMKLDYFIKEYLKLQNENKKDSITYFFEYWNLHSDLIYIIYNQNESIIQKVFRDNLTNTFTFNNDAVNDYFLALKISTMTTLLCKWVNRNKKETPYEMSKITKKIFTIKNNDLLTKF